MDSNGSTQTINEQPPVQVPGGEMSGAIHPTMHGKKVGMIVGIVVIVLIAGGAGMWAWFMYGMTKTPEQVLAKMLEQSKTINSAAFEATLKAGSTNLADPSKQDILTVTMRGAQEGYMLSTAKGVLNLDMSLAMAGVATPAEAALELRVLDSALYGQLTKLPDIGAFLFGAPEGSTADITNQVLNKWAFLDFNTTRQYLQDTKVRIDMSAKERAGIDMGIALLSGTQPSKAQTEQKIVELAQKNGLLYVKNILAADTLNNQAMYHYELAFNKEKVFPFWQDMMQAFAPDLYNTMTPNEMAATETEMNAALQQVQLASQVWIGKKDFLLHKMTFTVTPDPASEEGKQAAQTGNNPAITLEMLFKDYNKAVSVAKPDGAVSLLDQLYSLDQFQKQLTGTAPVPEPEAVPVDTETDTDADGLPDFMETQFYQTDPNNVDTDGDGYKDGDEVKNGYSPSGPGKLYE